VVDFSERSFWVYRATGKRCRYDIHVRTEVDTAQVDRTFPKQVEASIFMAAQKKAWILYETKCFFSTVVWGKIDFILGSLRLEGRCDGPGQGREALKREVDSRDIGLRETCREGIDKCSSFYGADGL
jgi:hypothetical protein